MLFFGVRRQSKAATALWIVFLVEARVRSPTVREGYVALADARASDTIQSAVAASLCRRTP